MNQKLELSLLDLGSTSDFKGHSKALQATIDCAILADELNFKRYWLGENYAKTTAWNYPVPLISILGGYTNNIRLGAGGIIIKHHKPFKLVSDFSLLSVLFPERIDLGIVGSSVDEFYIKALDVNNDYKTSVTDLIELIEHDSINGLKSFNPYYDYTSGYLKNNFWILGSGEYSLGIAKNNQLNYCYSLFHNNRELLTENYCNFLNYKKTIKHTSIAVAGLCIKKNALVSINNFQNKFYIPSVFGNKKEVKEKLIYYRNLFNVDEIVFFILSDNIDEKIETINSLSEIVIEINT